MSSYMKVKQPRVEPTHTHALWILVARNHLRGSRSARSAETYIRTGSCAGLMAGTTGWCLLLRLLRCHLASIDHYLAHILTSASAADATFWPMRPTAARIATAAAQNLQRIGPAMAVATMSARAARRRNWKFAFCRRTACSNGHDSPAIHNFP